ncbi:MAG: ribonuclease Z [Chitinophagales bacterium]|nr:ribonuclease Z [Chitinophagales bacterium]
MTFNVYILGSNSALPNHGRNPTAQAVQIDQNWYLIDCGEATQVRLIEYGIKWFKIKQIFISHLHGDHYYGLIGLLTTYQLLKRTDPLTIFAPPALEQIIQLQLAASNTTLNYKLSFVATQANTFEKIFEDNIIEVHSIPLNHKIDTTGFLFKQKQSLPNIDSEKIKAFNIDPKDFKQLKEGIDIVDIDGNTVLANEVTTTKHPLKSYAFCSDTCYDERIVPHIKDVDLLYHEATFLHDAKDRATETKHSTAIDAATIAQLANVKQLIIGHFSSRYIDLTVLEKEAKTVFENTQLAIEGKVFEV